MSPTRPITGVLPVVQTPYLETGGIDLTTLASEIDWALAQGVSGITTGMVSEILRLSDSELVELARVVCEVTASHGALSVISCGAESTHGARRLARAAEDLGADALMANPPITVALGDDALFGYFSGIVQEVQIPVVIQDASGYVGRSLSIDLQRRLLDTHGDQVYFKPEASPIGPRLSQLRDATDGRARILEGTGGAALIDSYRRGIVGTMPGTEVCWAIQRLWELAEAGRWEAAYAISGPLNSLISLQTSIDVFVAVEKHLLHRQGVLPNTLARGPLSFELDAETRAEADRLFDMLGDAVADSRDTSSATSPGASSPVPTGSSTH